MHQACFITGEARTCKACNGSYLAHPTHTAPDACLCCAALQQRAIAWRLGHRRKGSSKHLVCRCTMSLATSCQCQSQSTFSWRQILPRSLSTTSRQSSTARCLIQPLSAMPCKQANVTLCMPSSNGPFHSCQRCSAEPLWDSTWLCLTFHRSFGASQTLQRGLKRSKDCRQTSRSCTETLMLPKQRCQMRTSCGSRSCARRMSVPPSTRALPSPRTKPKGAVMLAPLYYLIHVHACSSLHMPMTGSQSGQSSSCAPQPASVQAYMIGFSNAPC